MPARVLEIGRKLRRGPTNLKSNSGLRAHLGAQMGGRRRGRAERRAPASARLREFTSTRSLAALDSPSGYGGPNLARLEIVVRGVELRIHSRQEKSMSLNRTHHSPSQSLIVDLVAASSGAARNPMGGRVLP